MNYKTSKGIVYILTDKVALTELFNTSIASVREYYMDPIYLLTNIDVFVPKHLDVDVRYVNVPSGKFCSRWIKTQLPKFTPYRFNLYLDNDILCQHNLDNIWSLLDNNDIYMGKDKPLKDACQKTFGPAEIAQTINMYGSTVNMYNAGVILWESTPPVCGLFESWHTKWREFNKYDQLAFLRAVYDTQKDVGVLPPVYNAHYKRSVPAQTVFLHFNGYSFSQTRSMMMKFGQRFEYLKTLTWMELNSMHQNQQEKPAVICVCGWYFNRDAMSILSKVKNQVYIVAHKDHESLKGINHTITNNVGLEFGAYDWFLKNKWDKKSDIIFIHDDFTADGASVLDSIIKECQHSNCDQAYIFTTYEQYARDKHHGRCIFMSASMANNMLEKNEGIWFDPNNHGYTTKTPMGHKSFNAAIYRFDSDIKKLTSLRKIVINDGIQLYRRGLNEHRNPDQIARQAVRRKAVQDVRELRSLLHILSNYHIERLVEIGTFRGGTMYALSMFASTNAMLISIDLPGGDFGGGYPEEHIEKMKQQIGRFQSLYCIRKDSHMESTQKNVTSILAGHPVDLLFIDADHTYDGVKKDFEMYAPLVKSGIIIFHDIVQHKPETKCEVKRFWDEIKHHYVIHEIIYDKNHPRRGTWGGFGLIFKNLDIRI